MDQILERLWVGDIDDALSIPKAWKNINVAFEHLRMLPNATYLPFMLPEGDLDLSINGFLLDMVMDVIETSLSAGETVLVTCNMGQERSPLAVVWYLYRRKGMTIDEAYKLVKSKRPEIYDRREWLAPLLQDKRELLRLKTGYWPR